MHNRWDQAFEYFSQKKFNCAESILLSFLKEEDQQLVRLATPFGGGVGGSKDLCGILTGGVLAIGYLLGRLDGEDQDSKFNAYDKAHDYYLWFEENHCTTCQKILPGNFRDHKEVCFRVLKGAVKYLEVILEEAL